jgi:hypothetical protein
LANLFEGTTDMKRQHVINLLEATGRDGIEKVVSWLMESDFFTAPASRKHHAAYPGGLRDHSVTVFEFFLQKIGQFDLKVPPESAIIAGVLHDVCKIGLYKPDEEPPSSAQLHYLQDLAKAQYRKYEQQGLTKAWATELIGWYKEKKGEGPEPTKGMAYTSEDKLPIGHGEKSVILLQPMITLTEQEIFLIRFHMGPFGTDLNLYNAAMELHPEIAAIFTSDMESTHLVEK